MAGGGGGKPKTQQKSITAFFGAGAKSSAPPKRKASEEDAASTVSSNDSTKPSASEAKETKKRKLEESSMKAKAPVKPAARSSRPSTPPAPSTTVVEQGDESMAEPEEEVIQEDGHKEEADDSAEDEASDVEAVGEAEVNEPSRQTVPGRRRLRRRVVDDDDASDEDDDDDMFGSAKASVKKVSKPSEVVEIDDDDEQDEDVTIVDAPESAEAEIEKSATEGAGENVTEDDIEGGADKEDADKEATKPITTPVSFFSQRAPKAKKDDSTKPKANVDSAITPLADDISSIPYTALAILFSKIEETSSRLVIQDLLTNFYREVHQKAPQDLLACIYLCVCTDLAPPFENLKIGIGDAILMKSIGEATGTTPKFIKEMYQKEGDLGKVAQNARSKQNTLSFASTKPVAAKPSVLSVPDVYNQFVKIAKMTGNNSQQQKCSIIKNLLVKCEKDKKAAGGKSDQVAEGAKYIIRGLQGKLRIGLAEKSILIGLTYSFMLEKDLKDKEKQEKALAYVKKAFAECPSYNALVDAFQTVQAEVETRPFLKVSDFSKVADLCVLTPGTPVSPMLARPTKAYAMVFDRFQGVPFTCEYKYDGERAQIHILPSGEISIFSRNFENSTERFPDVKLMIAKAAKKGKIKSCIVDAEVVAVDKETNKRLPFQVLSTRSRKNVKVEDIKVPVCIYAFDLLYLNGESLLKEQLGKRRQILKDMFEVEDGSFEFATSMDVDGVAPNADDAEAMEVAVDKVRTFLEEAVKENCEGLMVKTLEQEATYEPANRSHKWLKLKKDYLDGIGDSTDLVPIGAFHGRGKRTGVYGAYLLACYDPDTEMYQAITKLGTGLNDEQLKDFHEQLRAKVVDRPPSDYAIADGIKPDVWFEASCVWEILGADLSISPKYTAAMGLVAKDKGISLRFPRFIRIRDDKNPSQATTSSQIADLYRAQGLAGVGGEDEDDDMLI